jgi:hypothetical protein
MSNTVPEDAGLTEKDMVRIRRAGSVDSEYMQAILMGEIRPCFVCDDPTRVSVYDRYRDMRVGVCPEHYQEAFGDV